MKEEVETTLDTIEGWMTDEETQTAILDAFPDARARADIAHRLYDVSNWLSQWSLSIWPKDEQQVAAAQ